MARRWHRRGGASLRPGDAREVKGQNERQHRGQRGAGGGGRATPRSAPRSCGTARPRTVAEVGQPGPRLGLLASGVTRVLVFFDVLKFFIFKTSKTKLMIPLFFNFSRFCTFSKNIKKTRNPLKFSQQETAVGPWSTFALKRKIALNLRPHRSSRKARPFLLAHSGCSGRVYVLSFPEAPRVWRVHAYACVCARVLPQNWPRWATPRPSHGKSERAFHGGAARSTAQAARRLTPLRQSVAVPDPAVPHGTGGGRPRPLPPAPHSARLRHFRGGDSHGDWARDLRPLRDLEEPWRVSPGAT